MRTNWTAAFAAVALIAFFYGTIQMALLPLETGEAYPDYSTLRAGQKGAMALFESLKGVDGITVTRSFEPLTKLKSGGAAILLLGEDAASTVTWSESQLRLLESLAQEGSRLVLAFAPVSPTVSLIAPKDKPEIRKRWGIRLVLPPPSQTFPNMDTPVEERRQPATVEVAPDSGWQSLGEDDEGRVVFAEKTFGKGSIVVFTDSYKLSNEGLRRERDSETIAALIGPHHRIIFDESHLGVINTGSVGTLIRKYRLTGAFALAILLGLLFLWANSTSLLPRAAEERENVAAGADAQSGLVHLLKRSVAPGALIDVAWARWKETRQLGRNVSDARTAQAANLVASASGADARPAETYRRIYQTLTEKT